MDGPEIAAGGELRSAAILIVGDEILSGEVTDENAAHIARRLTGLGLRVHGIRVVPDAVEAIVHAISEARATADLLFISGGIGPTHDDLTREAVGAAIGVACVRHAEAEKRLRRGYGRAITAAELAMADLPAGAHLLLGTRTGAFGFAIESVYVLPGIPALLRDIVDNITADWKPASYFRAEIVTWLREGNVADELRLIQRDFPAVAIGSYPVKTEAGYRVRIVLRARERDALAQALSRVTALVTRGEGGVPGHAA